MISLGATRDLTLGIPQSEKNPLDLTGEQKFELEQAKWKNQAIQNLDSALLDWDRFAEGKAFDLSFAERPEDARKRGLVSSYLRIYNGGQEIGGGEIGPQMLRDKIALERFNGRGVGSDEEFFRQIYNEAKTRRDKQALTEELASDAFASVVTSMTETDKESPYSWDAFYEKAKTKPGYSSKDDWELRDLWERSQEQLIARVEPFQGELQEVWQAMKRGGAGTLSEFGKALIDEVAASASGMENPERGPLEELSMEDAGATAFRIYSELDEKDRPLFMDALGMLARTFPKEEQTTFFGNMAKQGGRDVDDLGRNVGSVPGTGEDLVGLGDFIGIGPTGRQLRIQADIDRRDILARRNFAGEVRRIERGEFNPLKSAFGGGDPGIIEGGLYRAPGAIASTVMAAVPYIGQAAIYSTMQGSAYDSIRENLMSQGVSDEKASEYAYQWADAVAVPQALLERLQAKAILGKLPVLEKVVGGIADRVKNQVLRGALRTGVGAAEESAIEVIQDYIPSVAQDIAAALSEDVPGVVWSNGKDGVLDGFWSQYAQTYVTMLPLAIIGAAGGVSRDQQIRAFREATDNQLLALGGKAEDVANFREASAKGDYSANAALERLISNLDPTSDTAKAASEAMIAEQEAAEQASKQVIDSGSFPILRQTPDGWIVSDRNTGVEYGPVKSSDDAIKLAVANFESLKSQSDDQIAYMASMLEASDAAAKQGKGKTETELDLGLKVTPAILAASSPENATRIREQIAAMEAAGEIKANFSGVVFGQSDTVFRQKQRETVNKLYQGSSVLTVFHELWHGLRREALATGRITRDEELDLVIAMDQLYRQSKNKRGLNVGLLPEGITRDQITETMVDEAISKIGEAEVLRSRQGGKSGKNRENAQSLDSGFITRNMKALAARGMRAAKKFSEMFNALRGYFGVAMARAIVMRKAQRDGTLEKTGYEKFLSKLVGLSEQDIVDNAARQVAQEITDTALSIGVFEQGEKDISDAVIKAREKLDAKKGARDQVTIEWEYDSSDPDSPDGGYWYPKFNLPEGDNYLKEFLPDVAIGRDDNGKYYVGEGFSDHDTLESAQAEALDKTIESLKEIAPSSTFGADQDAAEVTREVFYSFPQLPQISKFWEQTKWGSWYLEFKDSEENTRKISVRDHVATRADMGLPDRSFFVSKQWTPEEVGNALLKALDYMESEIGTDTALSIGEEILDPLISNAASRIKDPKQRARIFRGIVDRLEKLKALAEERGVTFNFDAFGKPFEGSFTDEKTQTLNALAVLDGILAALPPELRGRVGGYTQLAKLDTNEKRLDYLKRRIKRVDSVVQDYLRKEFTKDLEKIVERSEAKRKGGEKAKGKLGAEGHRFFEKVKSVMGLTEEEVEVETAKLDKDAEDIDPNDTEAMADLGERFQILQMFGNFKGKSLGDMANSVELAARVFDANRNLWRTQEEARLAIVKELANTAIKDLGGNSTAAVQEAKRKSIKALKAVQGGQWAIKSFSEVLEGVFGEESIIATRWGRMVRDGFRNKTTAIVAAHKRWKAAIEQATGKSGRAARKEVWKMATEQTVPAVVAPYKVEKVRVPIDTFFDAEDKTALGFTAEEVAQLTEQFEALPDRTSKKYLTLERIIPGESEKANFTEAEAIYLTMLWSQDGYKEAMRRHGLGEEFQADLESGMSDAAKSIRAYLAQEYADNYEPLRALYAKMYGVDLRQTENYTPGRFYSQGEDNTMDVTGSGIVEGGLKSGFLKDRKKHMAEARAENAFSIYFNHLNQTEHWKAMAEISREIHGVLGRPEVKKALAAKDPEIAPVLNDWMKAIDGNGLNNPKMSWILQAITTSQAYLAMSWKLSTILKNAIGATLNAAYRIGIRDYAVGMSRLMAGKVDFKSIWDSPLIQNRLGGGFTPEVRAAISNSFGAKPTLRGDFLMKGMEVIGTADSYGTAIGAAIAYDYHYRNALRSGVGEEKARAIAFDETAEVIARTAQPVEISDRSLMELRLSGIGKIAFVFASEARQKSSLWLTAWANTLTGKPTKKDLRVLLISHVVAAPIMHAIGAMIRDARDPGDDEWFDEKYWNPQDFLVAMATGPLAGIPLIRDVFDGFNGESGPLKRIVDSGDALVDLFMEEPKGDEMDWYERKITKVLQGMGPSVAVGASVFDQIYDFIRNFTED